MPDLTVVELFAGIGGVTGGFLDAGGFRAAYLNDADQLARSTFAENFPRLASRYHVGRVEELTGKALLDSTGGKLDGLLGCPPCQGFSPVGPRKKNDKRNALLHQFGRLVVQTRPRFFVMENVPALLQSATYARFLRSLGRRYAVHGEVVNAAEYGVPQLRRRAVVFGIQRVEGVVPTLPAPTHGGRGFVFDYTSGKYVSPAREGRNRLQLRRGVDLPARELVTVSRALGDLPAEVDPYQDSTEYSGPPRTSYQRSMRGFGELTNHRGWDHGDEIRRFIGRVRPGDCPRPQGKRSRNTCYFSQAYARLHPDGLARTITTNFHNPGSGRFTHHGAARTLTLREALRLQGFPDSFRLDMDELHHHQAERLVGNAFPRLLATALARHVRMLLA